MKRLIIAVLFVLLLSGNVNALTYDIPETPASAQEYIDENSKSFGDGLWFIIQQATEKVYPDIIEAGKICISLVGVSIFLSAAQAISTNSYTVVQLLGITTISVILMRSVNTMIHLGSTTIFELTEYGKLFVPVMTAALAAQGGTTTSAALYAGTVFFNTLLSTLVSKVLVPAVYIYLCLCIVHKATENGFLGQLSHSVKWCMTWGLKIILYTFTGYLSITGVVSGSADASLLKATKIMVSGAVPVVGNIIADASETILVSAGVMKNAAGIYGMLTIIAVCIGPFLKLGVHYLMLKTTGGICSMFVEKRVSGIIDDYSSSMGIVLAMVGTVCLLLLVSTVCFMKGVI